jgi:4'-phosphopantetheinyl transferase
VTPLGDDDAHLWTVRADAIRDPARLAAYRALLAPDEAERHARYLSPETRHEFLVTRALVRTVLSRYAPIAPAEWTFARTLHGRPEIAGPRGAPPLRFNLANTRGLVACVVARDAEVGVDAEDVERRTSDVEIAERFFSPTEVAALRAAPAERRQVRFFDYWTLKEAYLKARGLGLALPLDRFSFRLDEPGARREDGRSIGVSFEPPIEDDPAAWQFELFRPSERHTIAVAIRSARGTRRRVELVETVPLAESAG